MKTIHTILLVDDDHGIRRAIPRQLAREFQVVVHTAAGIGEMCNALAKFTPDLIILDGEMGDGTGIDAIEKLHAIGITAPIIAFSGNPDMLLSMMKKREKVLGGIDKGNLLPECLIRICEQRQLHLPRCER